MNQKTVIVGHSMGAAIAIIYAAAFPEQCSRIVCLDGAGPIARDPEDISRHIRSSITRRIKSTKNVTHPLDGTGTNSNDNGPASNGGGIIDAAIAARKRTADLVPGDQYISTEAAAAFPVQIVMTTVQLSMVVG